MKKVFSSCLILPPVTLGEVEVRRVAPARPRQGGGRLEPLGRQAEQPVEVHEQQRVLAWFLLLILLACIGYIKTYRLIMSMECYNNGMFITYTQS